MRMILMSNDTIVSQEQYLKDRISESRMDHRLLPEPQVTFVEMDYPPFLVKYRNTFRNICLISMLLFSILVLNTVV